MASVTVTTNIDEFMLATTQAGIQEALGFPVIENAAALLTIDETKFQDGQSVTLAGYYTAGDGGGQVLIYHTTGRPTADGGFYFDGPGADDYYEATIKDVANAKKFGAKGDGVTNDTAFVLNAVKTGVPYFPAGDYDLPSWVAETLTTSITMRGDGKLIGPNITTDFVIVPNGESIEVRGVKFDTWRYLFSLTDAGNFPSIKLIDYEMNEVGQMLFDTPGASTSIGNLIVHRGVITNVIKCGFRSTVDTTDYISVKDLNIKGTSASADSNPKGIQIGLDNDTANDFVEISGCKIEDISGTNTNVYGIIVFGEEVIITNNKIKDVTTTAVSDCEGVYTQSLRGIISNNILHDAGFEESAINIKGNPPGSTPEGNHVICSNNQIYFSARPKAVTIGIKVRRSFVTVHNNKIRGAIIGINVRDLSLTLFGVEVRNNDITELRQQTAQTNTTIIGIDVEAPFQNIRILDNNISDVGDITNPVSAYGIRVKVRNLDIADDITIRGNKIKDLNSSTGTSERGILGDVAGTETITNVVIENNHVSYCNTALRLNSTSVYSNLKIVDNSFDDNTSTEFNVTQLASGGHYVRHRSSGTPEASIFASAGSTWSRNDGGISTSWYVKETAAGNTGWSTNEPVGQVDSVSDLGSITSAANNSLFTLLGYYSPGDGGGQDLVYHTNGRPTADGGFYFDGAGADDYFEALDKSSAYAIRFGTKGDGSTDDSTFLQAAIDSGARKLVLVENLVYIISDTAGVGGLVVDSLDGFELDGRNATIKAENAMLVGSNTQIISFSESNNIVIKNLVLDGNRAARTIGGETTSHLLEIKSCKSVILDNVHANNGTADGFYIAANNDAIVISFPERITFTNCSADNNWRQGCSVINCYGIVFSNCEFSNTTGNDPGAGIDFESNSAVVTPGIAGALVENCRFSGNWGPGIQVASVADPEQIKIITCYFSGNGSEVTASIRKAIHGQNVSVQDCRFEGDYQTIQINDEGAIKDCYFNAITASTSSHTSVIEFPSAGASNNFRKIVDSCTFTGCSILIGYCHGDAGVTTFQNNKVDTCSALFLAQGKVSILNNTVEAVPSGGAAYAIQLSGTETAGSVISGNTITAAKANLVDSSTGADIVVSDNLFTSTGASGVIYKRTLGRLLASNNIINCSGQHFRCNSPGTMVVSNHYMVDGSNSRLAVGDQAILFTASGAGDPEGTFNAAIGSTWLRTDGVQGTTLYVKQSGTGNTGWFANGSEYVESFGAIGDGVTDDTVAIQAAADALESGGVLKFTGGKTYITSGYILMQNGSNFVIEGNGAIIKTEDGTIITNQLQEVFQFKLCDNFSVSDLTFDGNVRNRSHPNTQASTHCVHLLSCNNAVFTNCGFLRGAMDGVYIGSNDVTDIDLRTERVSFNNCLFDNNFRQGMSVVSAHHCEFVNCSFINTRGIAPQAGCDIEPNSTTLTAWANATAYSVGDIRSDPNRVEVYIKRVIAGTSGATFDATEQLDWEFIYQVDDVSFSGCSFEGNGGFGLSVLRGSGGTTTFGCSFNNNQRGQISANSDLTVVGGEVSDWRDPDAWVTATSYKAGDYVYDSISGEMSIAKTDFTSGGTYAADGSDTTQAINANEWYIQILSGAVNTSSAQIGKITFKGVNFSNLLATNAVQTPAIYSQGAEGSSYRIDSCTFDKSTAVANISTVKKLIFSNNTVRNISGIVIQAGDGAIISGNNFQDCDDRIVNCNSDGASISNNYILDCNGSDGCFRFFGDQCSAIGNTFELSSTTTWQLARYEGTGNLWANNTYINCTEDFNENGGTLIRHDIGSGTPESSQVADIGSTFLRTDGGASTTFYVKESGTGNTGWIAK